MLEDYHKQYFNTVCIFVLLTWSIISLPSCNSFDSVRQKRACSLNIPAIENCKCVCYHQEMDNISYETTYTIDTIKNEIISIDSIVQMETNQGYLEKTYTYNLLEGDSSIKVQMRAKQAEEWNTISQKNYTKIENQFVLTRTEDTRYNTNNRRISIEKSYNKGAVVDSFYLHETSDYSVTKSMFFVDARTLLFQHYDSTCYDSNRDLKSSVSRFWYFVDPKATEHITGFGLDSVPTKIKGYREHIVDTNNVFTTVGFEYVPEFSYIQWQLDSIHNLYQPVVDKIYRELLPKSDSSITYNCLLDYNRQVCNATFSIDSEQKTLPDYTDNNRTLTYHEKEILARISIYINQRQASPIDKKTNRARISLIRR